MPHYSTLDVDQFLIRLDLLETTAGCCAYSAESACASNAAKYDVSDRLTAIRIADV